MNIDPKAIPLHPSQSSSLSPSTRSPRPSKSIPQAPASSSGENNPPPRSDPKDEPSPSQNATKEQGKTQDQAAKVS